MPKLLFFTWFLSLAFVLFSQNGDKINHVLRYKDIDYKKENFRDHHTLLTAEQLSDSTSLTDKKILKHISPVFSLQYMPDLSGKGLFNSSIGGKATFRFADKLKGDLAVYGNLATFPDSIENTINSLSYIPKYGANYFRNGNLISILNLRGKLAYSPFHFLTFEIGQDKHFLGNGHRSLFLSDNAAAYPYFSTSLKIWHIHYLSMTTFFKDIYYDGSSNLSYKKKFSTIHYISWNIVPAVNLNLFEAVVWRSSDSALYNGMNINYLNPVIFMRPVEYSQGSVDNVLLGLGLNVKIGENVLAYSQAVLDEFYFREITNKGYRDNKFGYQLGVRGKHKSLKWLLEVDQVRPFTYSHYHTLQNYGHMHQPLAHPLGANFREITGELFYRENRFYSLMRLSYAHFGKDGLNSLHGNNIYENYWDVERFGHYLFDGVDTKQFRLNAKMGFFIKPEWNMALETGIVVQEEITDLNPFDYQYLYLGIKTLFYNDGWFE